MEQNAILGVERDRHRLKTPNHLETYHVAILQGVDHHPLRRIIPDMFQWAILEMQPPQVQRLVGFDRGLPLVAEAEGVLFVHASANRPEEWSYVTSDTKATPSFRASAARLILCGHVHVPLLASCDMGGMVREQAFRRYRNRVAAK